MQCGQSVDMAETKAMFVFNGGLAFCVLFKSCFEKINLVGISWLLKKSHNSFRDVLPCRPLPAPWVLQGCPVRRVASKAKTWEPCRRTQSPGTDGWSSCRQQPTFHQAARGLRTLGFWFYSWKCATSARKRTWDCCPGPVPPLVLKGLADLFSPGCTVS